MLLQNKADNHGLYQQDSACQLHHVPCPFWPSLVRTSDIQLWVQFLLLKKNVGQLKDFPEGSKGSDQKSTVYV